MSAGGTSYLLGSYTPADWTGSYSTSVAKARLAAVPTGADYRLLVRWRDGAATLSGRSAAITVKK